MGSAKCFDPLWGGNFKQIIPRRLRGPPNRGAAWWFGGGADWEPVDRDSARKREVAFLRLTHALSGKRVVVTIPTDLQQQRPPRAHWLTYAYTAVTIIVPGSFFLEIVRI